MMPPWKKYLIHDILKWMIWTIVLTAILILWKICQPIPVL